MRAPRLPCLLLCAIGEALDSDLDDTGLDDRQDTPVGNFHSVTPQTLHEELLAHAHQWPYFNSSSMTVECLQSLIPITPEGKNTLPNMLLNSGQWQKIFIKKNENCILYKLRKEKLNEKVSN